MPSKLSVFNDALFLMAQPFLESPDDPGEDAIYLRAAWDQVVDLCHEKTGWDHAKSRWALSRIATTPTHGFSYYYTIPSDCVRILSISDSGEDGDDLIDYSNEGRRIATDAETVYIVGISKSAKETPGKWSSSFAYYVATELAKRCAPKLNSAAVETIVKENRKALSDAAGLDATQGPPIPRRHGKWASAARGWSHSRDREQR